MNLKREFFMPVAVLVTICLVISAALALTNQVTAPIIAAAEQAAADAARMEVLPGADSFEAAEASGLPPEVREAYRAANGAGYVLLLTAKGYGGDINMICGIGPEGTIAGIQVLSHRETSGIGDKVTRPEFTSQFVGADAALQGVQAITGATVSSSAYIGAVQSALAAYEILEGGN